MSGVLCIMFYIIDNDLMFYRLFYLFLLLFLIVIIVYCIIVSISDYSKLYITAANVTNK